MQAFVLGLLAALVGVVGLSLNNAWLALNMPLPASLVAALLCGVLAALASTSSTQIHSPKVPYIVALLGGIGVALLGGPNRSLSMEFKVDRLLLSEQATHFGGWIPHTGAGMLLTASCGLFGAWLTERLRSHRPLLIRVVLMLVIVSFVGAAACMNPIVYKDTATLPLPRQYTVDGFLFMRVHHLMQTGKGYYDAFFQAYVQRRGESGIPGNWLNWRPPVLFYLWNVLPGGSRGLLYCFWTLAAITLVGSFGVARTLVRDEIALWSPTLLGAYLLYGADTIFFTSQEYWASFFMILGLWAWLLPASDSGRSTRALDRTRTAAGALMWFLAATSREHFLFLVPLLAIIAWRRRKTERTAALIALLSVFFVYTLHYGIVAHYVVQGNNGIGSWRNAGPDFVYHCLQFGTVYMAARMWLLFPLLAIGLVGAFLPDGLLPRVLTAGTVVIPLTALFFFGQEERWYWGIVVVPQMLVCVPLVALIAQRGNLSSAESVPSREQRTC